MPGGSNPAAPGGWSAFTASLSGNTLSVAGSLADGTMVSQSAMLLAGGDYPLFAPLYHGKGLLLGWLTFTNPTPHADEVLWMKPAGQENYPAGFSVMTNMIGSAYTKPSPGGNALVLTNTSGMLSQQGAGVAVATGVTLDHNKAKFTNDVDKVAITLGASMGTVSGTFVPSGAHKVPLTGVVLQEQGQAVGWFLEQNQSGSLSIR